jgi:hypothetical protein
MFIVPDSFLKYTHANWSIGKCVELLAFLSHKTVPTSRKQGTLQTELARFQFCKKNYKQNDTGDFTKLILI